MNSSLYIRTDVCSGVPGARRLPFVDTVALQRATRRRDWARVHAATSISGRMELWRETTENGALVMQVLSYWENACALLNYGLLHEDLFFETSGEFYGVWERVKTVTPQYRRLFASPLVFAHLEKAAERFEKWSESKAPGSIEAMRHMMKQMQSQSTAKATAKA